MSLRNRYAELVSHDRRIRFAIFTRDDQLYQIVEERIQSYEAGDADNPEIVPFPADGSWQPFWMIVRRTRSGLYGSLDDALREGTLLAGNDG